MIKSAKQDAAEEILQEEPLKKPQQKKPTKRPSKKAETGKTASEAKPKRRQEGPAARTQTKEEVKARHLELGRRGEDAAMRFLEHRGYDVLERNWKCKAGEADIIAEGEGALVFVEVKTRSNCDKGLPEEAVTAAKRKRYEKIAGYFLQCYDIVDRAVRFDVISILVVADNRAFLRHHRDAFSVGD